MKEKAVQAAVVLNGKTYTGESHSHALGNARLEGVHAERADCQLLFLTNKGRLVGKEEACQMGIRTRAWHFEPPAK